MRLDPGGRDDGRGAVGIGVVQKWEVKQQAKTARPLSAFESVLQL